MHKIRQISQRESMVPTNWSSADDLIRLDPTIPPPTMSVAREQDPEGRREYRQHLYRDRWLTFAPWRGVFYPDKLTQAKELQYAASKLTSIEINGTYYGSQKPESFRKWAHEVPDGFVFSLKGPRFATNRRVLAEAGDSVKRFYDSGVLELGDRLGPVLWQFAPDQEIRRRRFRQVPGIAAAQARRPRPASCRRSAP